MLCARGVKAISLLYYAARSANLSNYSFMISTLAFLGGLGGWELLLVLFMLLLLFGARRIPELARGLGRGIREFKDASTEIKEEIESATDIDDRKKSNKDSKN